MFICLTSLKQFKQLFSIRKIMFEMFKSKFDKFLDLPRSCGQNKNQSLEKLNSKMLSQIFAKVTSFSC